MSIESKCWKCGGSDLRTADRGSGMTMVACRACNVCWISGDMIIDLDGGRPKPRFVDMKNPDWLEELVRNQEEYKRWRAALGLGDEDPFFETIGTF
jgi:hypothetical protein